MNKRSRTTLGVGGGLVVLLVGALLFFTHSMAIGLLRVPIKKRTPTESPANYGLLYEDVTVTTKDGLDLVGWFIPSQNGAVVIVQHGGWNNRADCLVEADLLHRRGYGILLSTFRGRDLSEGEQITLDRETLDLEAWHQYLMSRKDLSHDRIGIAAGSYGAFTAIRFAAQNENIRAVVANSTIPSFEDIVEPIVTKKLGLPRFPFVLLIRFWVERETGVNLADLDATKWIGSISPRPILLIQGKQDWVLPSDAAQRLFDAAGEPKVIWLDPDTDHGDIPRKKPGEYQERVIGFLDKYLLGK